MSLIHVLDDNTINKIAAGEVVERPASVIKELIENAMDAGANRIEVEIMAGGTSFMRVTDNGCGMDAEQVQQLRNSIIVRNPNIKASIGLYNINQRIKLCYGSRYGLKISSVLGEGTTISLVIPGNGDSFMEDED